MEVAVELAAGVLEDVLAALLEEDESYELPLDLAEPPLSPELLPEPPLSLELLADVPPSDEDSLFALLLEP